MAKNFELLKILAPGQPRVAHVVKTCNTHETHVIIRVPAVIKTWGDTLRRESLGVSHGQSTVIGRVLHIGITGNSVCLAAYHWQMDFSAYWTWLAVLRQCFSGGTAADSHTPYQARPSQNLPKITTYDHVHQIFITSFTWFRRGVLCDRVLQGNPIRLPYHQNGIFYTHKMAHFYWISAQSLFSQKDLLSQPDGWPIWCLRCEYLGGKITALQWEWTVYSR